VVGNASTGVYVADSNDSWLLSNNQIYSNRGNGIELYASGARAVGNHVFGNSGTGIVTAYQGATARVEVVGNSVHDNGGDGITGSYSVLVQDN
jgi:parallel beta-helix repeat protein